MSDYARFKNIEPMYKARIKQQEDLIKALRAKIRLLENPDEFDDQANEYADEVIEKQTRIYEAEIVEED
jgi:hypothetical protein